jgi:hypothetical protein
MKWTNETPPIGVWAYSVPEGLFRIEGKTDTNYLITLRVCRLDHDRLETQTIYTVFVTGPFVYPLPDPTNMGNVSKRRTPTPSPCGGLG